MIPKTAYCPPRPSVSMGSAKGDLSACGFQVDIGRGKDDRPAEWVTQAFKKVGIEYRPSDLSKSDIYRDFLPRLNSGEVDLLDNAPLIAQLLSLERRTARAPG
jgi:hypothetical protein